MPFTSLAITYKRELGLATGCKEIACEFALSIIFAHFKTNQSKMLKYNLNNNKIKCVLMPCKVKSNAL